LPHLTCFPSSHFQFHPSLWGASKTCFTQYGSKSKDLLTFLAEFYSLTKNEQDHLVWALGQNQITVQTQLQFSWTHFNPAQVGKLCLSELGAAFIVKSSTDCHQWSVAGFDVKSSLLLAWNIKDVVFSHECLFVGMALVCLLQEGACAAFWQLELRDWRGVSCLSLTFASVNRNGLHPQKVIPAELSFNQCMSK
jgi:hypothetical protein